MATQFSEPCSRPCFLCLCLFFRNHNFYQPFFRLAAFVPVQVCRAPLWPFLFSHYTWCFSTSSFMSCLLTGVLLWLDMALVASFPSAASIPLLFYLHVCVFYLHVLHVRVCERWHMDPVMHMWSQSTTSGVGSSFLPYLTDSLVCAVYIRLVGLWNLAIPICKVLGLQTHAWVQLVCLLGTQTKSSQMHSKPLPMSDLSSLCFLLVLWMTLLKSFLDLTLGRSWNKIL